VHAAELVRRPYLQRITFADARPSTVLRVVSLSNHELVSRPYLSNASEHPPGRVPGVTFVHAAEVREATNKSPHVCARARVGERPVSG
jgi:hypothetical protein